MKALLLACVVVGVLGACGDDEKTIVSTPINPNAPTVKALPFTIEGASLSDAFRNNLKVAKVEVGVNGGSASEWSATAIAIAEKVATFGADLVEISVRRNEITQPEGNGFRVVAESYYSPDPNRSVWEDGKKWQVLQADPASIATQQDVNISADFDALYRKFVDSGMGLNDADAKAGAVIAKKYNLAKDWRLPTVNQRKEIPRDSMNIDAMPAANDLAILERCLNGKIIYRTTTCSPS